MKVKISGCHQGSLCWFIMLNCNATTSRFPPSVTHLLLDDWNVPQRNWQSTQSYAGTPTVVLLGHGLAAQGSTPVIRYCTTHTQRHKHDQAANVSHIIFLSMSCYCNVVARNLDAQLRFSLCYPHMNLWLILVTVLWVIFSAFRCSSISHKLNYLLHVVKHR